MKIGLIGGLFVWLWMLAMPFSVQAQDLGPGFTKVKDGIYVYAAKEGNSTCSVVLTEEGPVIIDTCQSAAGHAPVDGRREEAHGQASTFRHRHGSAQ